jgi:AcrR family transcriptional regulator
MMFVSSHDALPEPPWSSAKPRSGPAKAPITREAIVDAAMAILDAHGLDAVSMRSVADRLGTGPASLYAHVSGKRELTALMLDRVIGEVPLREPDPARWQQQLHDAMVDMHRVLTAHRDIARVAIGEIPTGHNALISMESFLGVLLAGGVPEQAAAYGSDVLALYVVASAFEDSVRAEAMGLRTEEEALAYFEGVHDYFASLPAERFPVLTGMLPYLTESEGDRFAFGLDLMIAGLAAMATPPDNDESPSR